MQRKKIGKSRSGVLKNVGTLYGKRTVLFGVLYIKGGDRILVMIRACDHCLFQCPGVPQRKFPGEPQR